MYSSRGVRYLDRPQATGASELPTPVLRMSSQPVNQSAFSA